MYADNSIKLILVKDEPMQFGGFNKCTYNHARIAHLDKGQSSLLLHPEREHFCF